MHAFDADCVVITPGLVEAWWDNEREIFIQEVPWTRDLREYLKRTTFVQLDYAQSVHWQQRTIGCICSMNQCAKILITTSPVPLGRTFTGDDIVVANTYAKSTLRAACGDICRRNRYVGYFASYEMAMISPRDLVWEDDGIHVQRQFVEKIVSNLGDIYFPDVLANLRELMRVAASSAAERESRNAARLHAYGSLLLGRGDARCIAPLAESVRLEASDERLFHLALAHSRLGAPDMAKPMLEELSKQAPKNISYLCASVECGLKSGNLHFARRSGLAATLAEPSAVTFYWLGEACLAPGQPREAAAAASRGLEIEPGNVHCEALLARATPAPVGRRMLQKLKRVVRRQLVRASLMRSTSANAKKT